MSLARKGDESCGFLTYEDAMLFGLVDAAHTQSDLFAEGTQTVCAQGIATYQMPRGEEPYRSTCRESREPLYRLSRITRFGRYNVVPPHCSCISRTCVAIMGDDDSARR